MSVRIDVHHHFELGSEVVRLILERIGLLQETIMAALDGITTQVHSNTSAIESAILLINGIADRIAAAAADPAALDALVTELRGSDERLAAAVAANTPAAPPTA